MSRCAHVGQIRMVTPSAKGCEDCLRIGARWVHLRPIVRSFHPGEDWAWCYVDEVVIKPVPAAGTGRCGRGSRPTPRVVEPSTDIRR
jgi:hypothetical protein